jgi:hypothetical protein
MKNSLIGIAALCIFPTVAAAAEKPDWAFPVTEKVQPPPRFEGARARPAPPGSTLSITRAKADDMYDIPNWYPAKYPPMPKIVQYGNKDTQVRACGSCHLPTGTGHDESAYMAALPAPYFIRQMQDWKTGDRKFSPTMVAMAKVITDAEIKEAADYFTAVKPTPWIRVVEADTVPRSYIGPGNKRLIHPDGGSEPLGNRIIEVPEDEEIVLYRDPSAGFVAMCRMAASRAARSLPPRAAAARPFRAASVTVAPCRGWARCLPSRAAIPITSFASSGTCTTATA